MQDLPSATSYKGTIELIAYLRDVSQVTIIRNETTGYKDTQLAPEDPLEGP